MRPILLSVVKKNMQDHEKSLEVLPLREFAYEDKTKAFYNPILPSIARRHGSSILHLGPPQSGKSTLLSNLLLRFYCDNQGNSLFDDVYIFSSSILLGDSSTAALRKRFESTIFTDPTTAEADMQRILDYQDSFPVDPDTGETDRPSIAIVLDDIIPWQLKRNSALYNIASTYRHHGIDLLLYLTQKYRSLPPIIRSTVGHLWCHQNGNAKEMEAIAEECYVHRFPGGIRGFEKMLTSATSKSRYDFLNLRLLDKVPVARRSFQEILFEGTETGVLHRGAAPSKWSINDE